MKLRVAAAWDASQTEDIRLSVGDSDTILLKGPDELLSEALWKGDIRTMPKESSVKDTHRQRGGEGAGLRKE